jgi:hypothetical protein
MSIKNMSIKNGRRIHGRFIDNYFKGKKSASGAPRQLAFKDAFDMGVNRVAVGLSWCKLMRLAN